MPVYKEAELIERDAWLDMFQAAPPHVVEALGLASCRIGDLGLLASRTVPINECNRVMAVGVETPLAAEDLRQAAKWFEDQGVGGWAIQVSPPALEKARELLEDLAASPSGNGWAKFAHSGIIATTPLDPAGRIEVIAADPGNAAAFGRVVQAGFGLPAVTADWFAALVGRPGWACSLVRIDGEDASAGTMFVRGSSAWLGADASLPDFRGRGGQLALVRRRMVDAYAAGVSVMTAETGHPLQPDAPGFSSFRNYERAGFERLYNRPNFKIAH